MQIAIIGAGNVGGTLGRRWAAAGHDVMFGVRDRHSEKAQALLARMKGPGLVSVGSNDTAPAWAEVIVLCVPWNVAEQAIAECGDLSGKIVIDATNPVKLGATDELLELGFDTSGGERIATWAKGAQVFKSLNQVGWEIMADPVLEGRRAVMFFAGPDGEARDIVSTLIETLGFEAIHVGGLKMARLLEPFGMTWIQNAIMMGMGRDWALSIVRRGE